MNEAKMKKSLWVLTLAALFTFAALLTEPLAAAPAVTDESGHYPYGDMAIDVFTATVTLVDMTESDDGDITMTIALTSGNLEVTINPLCPFYDERGGSLSPAYFLERYSGQMITIDYLEVDSQFYVDECRGGTK